jgi:hypothetical protein
VVILFSTANSCLYGIGEDIDLHFDSTAITSKRFWSMVYSSEPEASHQRHFSSSMYFVHALTTVTVCT